MENIQDWLVAQGFVVDHSKNAFVKLLNYFSTVTIPFEELRGQTVNTFKAKAVKNGWVSSTEAFGR